MKGDFLEILLTRFFGVRNFGNTSARRVIFFENIQNLMYISKMKKQIQKMLSVSEVIAFEYTVLNCLYSEENTCHRLPVY